MKLLTCLFLTAMIVPYEGLENTSTEFEERSNPSEEVFSEENFGLEEVSAGGLGGISKTAHQIYAFVSTMSNEYMRLQIALNQLVEGLLGHPFNWKDAANSFNNLSMVLEATLNQIEFMSSRYNFLSTESLNLAVELLEITLVTAKELVDSFNEISTLEIFNNDNIETINDCVGKFSGKAQSAQVNKLFQGIASRGEVIASNLVERLGVVFPRLVQLALNALAS